MKNPRVLIIMGSDSDLTVMEKAEKILDDFNISYETTISSAHRSPARTHELAGSARANGIRVIIAGAGMAAHLAGAVAAHTTLPVIGVPIKAERTIGDGMDAVLSTVNMPPGIPVATVGIGAADNAAYLACQILAATNLRLASKLGNHRAAMEEGVVKKSEKLKDRKKEKKV